jgi:hypothetical protein
VSAPNQPRQAPSLRGPAAAVKVNNSPKGRNWRTSVKAATKKKTAQKKAPARSASAYKIGGNYMFRTVTHIVTGKLESIHNDGLRVSSAAWIADTGRYAQAVATGEFSEVEPYPAGATVVVNHQAMIDAVEIPKLPRTQK